MAMKQRRGPKAQWVSQNPLLASGEIGVEIENTSKFKIGDGSTLWNDLPYGGSNSQSLEITTVGSLQNDLIINFSGSVGLVSAGASGTSQINESGDISISSLNYAETSGSTGISYLSFDNLSYCQGDFALTVPGLTGLNLPKLKITGNIQLSPSPNLSQLNVPSLSYVTGNTGISIASTGITFINFPELMSSTSLSLSSATISNISCPILTKCNGSISITSSSLSSVDFSSLATSSSGFQLNSPTLTYLSLPLATNLGAITLTTLGLTGLSFPNLNTAPSLNFNTSSLSYLQLPSLVSITSNLGIVLFSTGLTGINFPSFTMNAGVFSINSPTITGISAPLFTSSTGLTLTTAALTNLNLPAYTGYGPLTINANNLTSLSLPNLATTNVATFNTNNLGTLYLPGLTGNTGGTFAVNSTGMTSMSMPSWQSNVGSLNLNLPSLTSLNLNSLTTSTALSLNLNSLPSLSLPSYVPPTNVVIGIAGTNLGSISMPGITSCNALGLTGNPNLTNLSLPSLITVNGVLALNLPSLNSLNLNSLVNATNFYGNNLNSLGTLSLPNFCVGVNGNIGISGSGLTAISFPGVTGVGSMNINNCPNLLSVSMPSIISISSINPSPLNMSVGNGSITDLTNFLTVGIVKRCTIAVNGTINFSNNALTQASVDHILAVCASLDGTNGTTNFTGHTINLNGGTNATPSAAGQANKSIIVARNNIVNTN